MHAAIRWLHQRTENVAAGILAAMFLSFMLQIVSRYVFNSPIGWTLEVCLTTWLWLVLWTAAFNLKDVDHVRFDMVYMAGNRRLRRIFALISAIAIVVGFVAALPATLDYITFYKIKKSATLRIRLDVVFSVYAVFALAVITRYALRAWYLVRGGDPDSEARSVIQ
ncbi:MAG: Tripartite ATP-independent periplasmic transporter DctQ component [Rhizobiaceae bacterium]|nr:Tripartite ATP-independent periplasmic transporter DctQ component [Rhizobiaceae bacterium]